MTTTYAALLRGINVGGNKKVPMAELRALLEELGHQNVCTYLNSGNAVFTSESSDEDALAAELERAIEKHFGFPVPVMVRDGGCLKAVAEACPFPAAELQARQLHVTFFSQQPGPERFASLDTGTYLPEEFRLGDRALYLYAPEGLGKSKLGEVLHRPSLLKGIQATSRNWNTVTALVEMTSVAG
ncbi:DUF1697 domain-containing protein [Streptomyces sannanensis]|uniref:DUF1697 domain-containing protein n=1 Tax=Streptomyces sannanensis TaxID=285536 RepID=A0ABP6SI51_9ACTN